MKNDLWFVYILECGDCSYYTGVTNDLNKRMNAHAEGKGSKYVCKKGFNKLLFAKLCGSRSNACKCEAQIKKLSRNKKLDWFKN